MPRSAPSQCLEPNCPTLCQGTPRCPEHTQRKPSRRPSTAYEAKAKAFYASMTWRKLSEYHRTRSPLCVACESIGRVTVGDVADHIVEIKDDWSLRAEPTNLQTLCHSCHNTKTAQVKGARGAQKTTTNNTPPQPIKYRG
jgi:5-methylcytosine-specific restriction protein A